MAHNLTETATYDATVAVPDDGDNLDASSVIVGIQPVTNRTKYLKAHLDPIETYVTTTLNGMIFSPGFVESIDGSSITVGDMQSLNIGGVHFGEQSAVTISPGLPGSGWAYLYAFNNSGVIDYEVSTTPPAGNLGFMFGDSTRKFICSLYVRGGLGIRPFIKNGNVYTYEQSADSTTPGINVTATSYTDVDLTTLLPPTSRVLQATFKLTNGTAATTSSITYRTRATDASEYNLKASTAGSNVIMQHSRRLVVDANRFIQAYVTTSAGTLTGTIIADGYSE